MSTHRFRMDIIVFAPPFSRFSAFSPEGASTLRPTIHLAMLATLACRAGTSCTTKPSRMTTTLSHTARISWRRWVIKITAMPWAAIRRMESSSASASFSVSTAVGSSRISSFSWSLLSSRAISVNCL